MIRRPPRSTRTDTLFPSRRSSDLLAGKIEHRRLGPPLEAAGADARDRGFSVEERHQARQPSSREASSRNRCLATLPLARRGNCSSRSEEHTSELQSLMRISYAVFCLKKKK